MTPKVFTTEGIILARRQYSEADRILSVFTKDYGRLVFIAKGVRKPASRKRGHIEIFTYLKLHASRGKGIEILTEAEIIDNFTDIRKNLRKVALAYYFMEVVGRTTKEGAASIQLFYLILHYLRLLTKENKLKHLRKEFVGDILTTLGYWPAGKPLLNPDELLAEVTERQLTSVRVGKKLSI